jgi:MoxR-like ATPase
LELREQMREWESFAARFRQIEENVERVVRGKNAEIRLALVALVAEGHLLIEDVPGVGKTMLAKAIARSIDCSFRRIQFTPDMLPTDITGVNVFNQERVTSSSGPERCSRTSCSATKSTVHRRRPSRHCWSAWKSDRSRSTPRHTPSGRRSW